MRSALVAALAALTGCSTAAYYAQSVTGHLALLARREPVAALIGDPATGPGLRARLRTAGELRDFASRSLALPENRSYRDYVDVGGPFVVWNVVVAPELSLAPRRWCFVVVGCVAYRGYYDETHARAFAERWRGRGHDVAVTGVRAYSTLGWLADPLLSTMLVGPPTYVASIMFHELAHQVVYVRDDTAFNEAFAVAVEGEGVRRWVHERGDAAMLAAYEARRDRHGAFLALVLAARADLEAVYASERSEAQKRLAKAARLELLRRDYARLRARWGGFSGYDAWFERDLNNARLALVATYHGHVPAFERLLAEHGHELPRFYAAVERLGALPKPERDAALNRLLAPRAMRVTGASQPPRESHEQSR